MTNPERDVLTTYENTVIDIFYLVSVLSTWKPRVDDPRLLAHWDQLIELRDKLDDPKAALLAVQICDTINGAIGDRFVPPIWTKDRLNAVLKLLRKLHALRQKLEVDRILRSQPTVAVNSFPVNDACKILKELLRVKIPMAKTPLLEACGKNKTRDKGLLDDLLNRGLVVKVGKRYALTEQGKSMAEKLP